MKYALISSTAPKKCMDSLSALGYTVLPLPPFEKLGKPVCTHADMLFFSYSDTVITHKEYYKRAREIFDTICSDCRLKLVLTDDDIRPEYPRDIAFNAIALGGVLYSNTPCTSSAVSDIFSERVHVKQGYSACSTLVLSDRYVITADPSLSREYGNNGIEVCLISNGSISLPPYDCGFIGGASGVDGDTVYFTGSIDLHEDGERIKSVIYEHNMKTISLSDDTLFDVGGIKFFHL